MPAGPQGPPGDVNFGDLNNAIDGTASNLNGVVDLNTLAISNPPTQAEVEEIRLKIN